MPPLRVVIMVGLLAGATSLAGLTARAGEAGLIGHFPFDGKACYQPLTPMGKGVECVVVDGREGVRLIGQSYLEADGAPFDRPSLSISLWFYLEGAGRDEMKLVMRDQGETLRRVFQLQVYNPQHGYGESRIRFLGETGPGGGWEIAAVTETGNILPGSWHHLVVTVRAEDAADPGAVSIWVDGRQERPRPPADENPSVAAAPDPAGFQHPGD